MHMHRADEVGAAGTSAKRDVLDRQMRLTREHVREQPPNLDPRSEAFNPDALGSAGLYVPAYGAFEGFGGARFCKNALELAQIRSSSTGLGVDVLRVNIVTSGPNL
jgi:hypothetical protein